MLKIKHIFCFPKSALMPSVLVSLKGTIIPHTCFMWHILAIFDPIRNSRPLEELSSPTVSSSTKCHIICSHCQHPSSDLGYLFCELFWWVSNCSCWLQPLLTLSHLHISSSRIFLNTSYPVSTSISICMPTAWHLKSSRIWPHLI